MSKDEHHAALGLPAEAQACMVRRWAAATMIGSATNLHAIEPRSLLSAHTCSWKCIRGAGYAACRDHEPVISHHKGMNAGACCIHLGQYKHVLIYQIYFSASRSSTKHSDTLVKDYSSISCTVARMRRSHCNPLAMQLNLLFADEVLLTVCVCLRTHASLAK